MTVNLPTSSCSGGIRKVAATAALLACALICAPDAFGQDDIEEPASELPEGGGDAAAEAGDDGGAGGDEFVTGDAGEGAEGAGELPESDGVGGEPGTGEGEPGIAAEGQDDAVADGGAGAKAEEEPVRETWDSYSEQTFSSSVAQEVTKGVRVEDIVEPPTEYRYAAFGKPDPFVPPMVTEEDPEGASALEVPIISRLQRFPLNELRVIGVWQLASGVRKALVMTPRRDNQAEEGIVVKNGDPIGKRGGKILSIGDEYLTVREFYVAEDGTRQFEDTQMFLGTRERPNSAYRMRFEPGEKDSKLIMENDPGAPVPVPPAGGNAGANGARMRPAEPVRANQPVGEVGGLRRNAQPGGQGTERPAGDAGGGGGAMQRAAQPAAANGAAAQDVQQPAGKAGATGPASAYTPAAPAPAPAAAPPPVVQPVLGAPGVTPVYAVPQGAPFAPQM